MKNKNKNKKENRKIIEVGILKKRFYLNEDGSIEEAPGMLGNTVGGFIGALVSLAVASVALGMVSKSLSESSVSKQGNVTGNRSVGS